MRVLLIVLIAALSAAFLFLALHFLPDREPTAAVGYVARDWSALDDWRGAEEALVAYVASCEAQPWRRAREIEGLPIDHAAWRQSCETARETDPSAARAFFESQFRPIEILLDGAPAGFFTGYFEPQLRGSRTKSEPYVHPLYRRPDDLISVELGRFRPDLDGRRIAGRVEQTRLVPYDDRAEIDGGSLAGRGLELVWTDDPIEAFFLHIQGSGRVALEDGGEMRVGYDGQNGHPYHAIGRTLIEMGEVAREDMSLEAIEDWLRAHPDRAGALMAENPSYIFFRALEGPGPVGSLGVALTPEASLAVDPRAAPLGLPVVIDTKIWDAGAERDYDRLLIAQDTGGAITGAGRGDIFFGAGPVARARAAHQKMSGRFVLLLPVGPSA